MEEVDLSPLQGSFGAVGGIRGAGLHALHMANMLDLVNGAIAVVLTAGSDSREQGGDGAHDAEQLEHDDGLG